MGCAFFLSSSSRDCSRNPNPNPVNFTIQRMYDDGRFVVVQIIYPDCDNYEGNKILVFEGLDKEYIMRMVSIDPHFSANDPINSPIARFVPNQYGWRMAIKFINTMNDI